MKLLPLTKGKLIFGVDWKYYFYVKAWHLIHTKDETRDQYFNCLLCKDPNHFKEQIHWHLKWYLKDFYYKHFHYNFIIKKIKWNLFKLKCYLLHQDINEVILIKLVQQIKELQKLH